MQLTQTSNFQPARTLGNPTPPPTPSGSPNGPEKPSGVDSFSQGVSHGGNIANGLIGAWNGAAVGVMGGAAVGLGGSILHEGLGALHGTSHIGLGTLLHTAGSTGLWAAGGGIAGALVGGLVANKLGHGVGNFGAHVAEKFGADANIGRAVGTIATGVALGTLGGLGVAGFHGATIALTCGLAGGALAYFKS